MGLEFLQLGGFVDLQGQQLGLQHLQLAGLLLKQDLIGGLGPDHMLQSEDLGVQDVHLILQPGVLFQEQDVGVRVGQATTEDYVFFLQLDEVSL